MPLLVQNNSESTTLFAIGGGKQPLIWKPKGDISGEDVQRVPTDLADDIDFLRALDNGILTVINADDPEVLARLQRETSAFADRQKQAAAAQEAVLDRRQDRDLIAEGCIGPHANGRGVEQCGAPVLMRAKEKDLHPPLCPRHKGMEHEFYLTQTGSKGEGATDYSPGQVSHKWSRVQMTAPQRG